jgi:hypothetical protein
MRSPGSRLGSGSAARAVAFALLVGSTCLVPVGGEARAEALVIGSTVATIVPGSTLADATTIDVPAGGRLTLLLADGRTEVIEGPRQGRVGDLAAGKAADGSLWGTVKGLVTQKGGTTSRVGATRSAVAAKTAPLRAFDLADIPPTVSGRWCVPPGTRPTFTRRSIGSELRIAVKLEGGAEGVVHFPAGADTAAWPAALPVTPGRVTIAQPRLSPRGFELRPMQARPERARLLSALLAEGCEAQARLWIRELTAPAPR